MTWPPAATLKGLWSWLLTLKCLVPASKFEVKRGQFETCHVLSELQTCDVSLIQTRASVKDLLAQQSHIWFSVRFFLSQLLEEFSGLKVLRTTLKEILETCSDHFFGLVHLIWLQDDPTVMNVNYNLTGLLVIKAAWRLPSGQTRLVTSDTWTPTKDNLHPPHPEASALIFEQFGVATPVFNSAV